MKKTLRVIFGVLALVTFVATGTVGAAASSCAATSAHLVKPDQGAGDYGVMN